MTTAHRHAESNQQVDDKAVLSALYQSRAGAAARLAYVLVGDQQTAQEIVQEAFARLWARLHKIRRTEKLDVYLFTTVANLSRGQLRRRRIERAFVARGDSIPSPGRASSPTYEGDPELWRAVMQLSSRQKQAVFLRYYEDLSELQTAEILGCSTSAVKSLINRALKNLRRNLGGNHGDTT